MAEDVAPRTTSAYLDPSYWDERFGKEEHYEWFKDFSYFRHLLAPPSRFLRSGAATRSSGRSSCGRASPAASPASISRPLPSSRCATAWRSRAPMVWRWWWRTCSTCRSSARASTS